MSMQENLLQLPNMTQLKSICISWFSLFIVMSVAISQLEALSLISEKCDPSKVGPDETTVKGGWQAEMFNGLAFRACGK